MYEPDNTAITSLVNMPNKPKASQQNFQKRNQIDKPNEADVNAETPVNSRAIDAEKNPIRD